MPVSRRGFFGRHAAAPREAILRRSTWPLPQVDGFTVAFVYAGPVDDLGWNAAIDRGREELAAALPGISTTVEENVKTPRADAESKLRQLAASGVSVIVATQADYGISVISAARDFPDVRFISIAGQETADNVSTIFGWIEEPRYVSGMLAAKMSKEKRLGFVAGYPTPRTLRSLNAFTLGARKANPSIVVEPYWSFDEGDPQVELQASGYLIQNGADVVEQRLYAPEASVLAADNDAYSIGYPFDVADAAPDAVLTSVLWNWGPYFIQAVQAAMDGTWAPESLYQGWQQGLVDLAPLGAAVKPTVKEEIEAEIARFRSGEATIDTIFAGPITDNAGEVRVVAGAAPTVDDLLGMNFLVDGVEGNLPS